MEAPADAAGIRLDAFLASCQEMDLTRSAARKLCADGRVQVDGALAKPATRLKGGETVTASLPPPPPAEPGPEDLGLTLVHVDEHVAVLDKPVGMVVHPAPGHPTGTAVNGLLHLLGPLPISDDPSRPGIVHRLDRDTSGLMVVARTPAALETLQAAIRAREVTRRYLLVVRNARQLPEAGTWDTPYGRHPGDRKRMSSRHEGARRAVTHWRRIEALGDGRHALVEATLETGRTHQIRAHFCDARFPVLGDRVYGRPDPDLPRQFLHAAALALIHPVSGVDISMTSPLPADLAQ